MTEVVKYLRSRKEEARELVPEHLQHYLDSRILPSSWYPEEDYLELIRIISEMIPASYREGGLSGFEVAGRTTSRRYVDGAYGPLVRDDPHRTLKNFQALWRLRHDTGEIQIEHRGEFAVRIELRDFALVDSDACEVVQGSFWGFLHHSGAADPRFEHTECRARGDSVCAWDVDWS